MTDLLAFARELATAINRRRDPDGAAPWFARAGDHAVELVRGDGACFSLTDLGRGSYPARPGRVAVDGHFARPTKHGPSCVPWDKERHAYRYVRATFRADLGPERAARELCKRRGFLEQYEPAWVESARTLAGQVRDERARDAFWKALGAETSETMPERAHVRIMDDPDDVRASGVTLTLCTHDGRAVSLERTGTLPAALVTRMLDAARAWAAEQCETALERAG